MTVASGPDRTCLPATPRWRVEILCSSAPSSVFKDLDALFRLAVNDLVPRGARLEPARERASEGEVDPERLVLVAYEGALVVGAVDVRLALPSPSHLTVQQIVVAPFARRQGVARTLLRSACDQATRCGLPLLFMCAQVLRKRNKALEFWVHLGAIPLGQGSFELDVRALEASKDTGPGAR